LNLRGKESFDPMDKKFLFASGNKVRIKNKLLKNSTAKFIDIIDHLIS
jgi:hypothetical protein